MSAALWTPGLLAAAWFGAEHFFLRNVRTLLNTARRISAGDLSARTGMSYGNEELSQIGKAFDESAPISPLKPIAATGELTRGAITLAVNGQPRQKGDLSELIWNVNETIAALSQAWALAPGDLIYTGTPAGVGPVVPGDVLVGRIEGLGEITLKVGPAE